MPRSHARPTHAGRDLDSGLAEGGEYVVKVKANRKNLCHRFKVLPRADTPGHTATQTGHGRRATRTIKVAEVPAWNQLAVAAEVAQPRHTVTRAGRKNIEVVDLLTSATPSPVALATWIQARWEIENRLHWVRDVTYDEAPSRIRTGNALESWPPYTTPPPASYAALAGPAGPA